MTVRSHKSQYAHEELKDRVRNNLETLMINIKALENMGWVTDVCAPGLPADILNVHLKFRKKEKSDG